jgi:hypothetical protein
MIKCRLQEFVIHPVFISLIIWGVIVWFIPPLFQKYRVSHLQDVYTGYKNKYYYIDLDGDRISEKILLDFNDSLQTKVQVIKDNKVHDQYDLKYRLGSANSLFSGDYNHDGCKELYIFTISEDSIFLHVIDPVKTRRVIVPNRFIDLRRKALYSIDEPQFNMVGMVKKPGEEFSGFVFIINSGYSLQPRNVYNFNIAENTLLKSPESAASIIGCVVSEINGDSMPDLILTVMAPGNFNDNAVYSDHYSWLMVLDDNLRFEFEPVRFDRNPDRLMVIPLKLKNQSRLVLFHDYFGTADFRSSFYLFDSKGNKIFEKGIDDFESVPSIILANDAPGKSTFYFLKNRRTEVEELDSSFHVVRTTTIPTIEQGDPLAHFDANFDGKKEYFFEGENYRSLVIAEPDFKHAVAYSFKKDSGRPHISQVLRAQEKPDLYLQYNDYGSFIHFDKNLFYYLKYPFYLTLYLAVLLFILILEHIQHYRLNLKQATERKIAALQMKAIKNQIDPHFTLNILNAIGSLYAGESNREEADYIFGKYAKLIRQTVISSDQIIITLADELDFTKNYVDLERWRCHNTFTYSIEVDTGIDLQKKIPRTLIHTFVENSIKYGLRNKCGDGKLKISLQNKGNKYMVIVQDNGPGLQSAGVTEQGTGKGLLILSELTDLYFKLEKVRITHSVQNCYTSDGRVSGTRAVIEIQN